VVHAYFSVKSDGGYLDVVQIPLELVLQSEPTMHEYPHVVLGLDREVAAAHTPNLVLTAAPGMLHHQLPSYVQAGKLQGQPYLG
jgi:hypothetical protein